MDNNDNNILLFIIIGLVSLILLCCMCKVCYQYMYGLCSDNKKKQNIIVIQNPLLKSTL